MTELDVTHEPQKRGRRASAAALELVDVAFDQPAATRTLERGIGGQLHDVRLARNARAERAPPEHPRRVHDIGLPRAALHERGAAVVPHSGPVLSSNGADRIWTVRRRGIRSGDDFHLVST